VGVLDHQWAPRCMAMPGHPQQVPAQPGVAIPSPAPLPETWPAQPPRRPVLPGFRGQSGRSPTWSTAVECSGSGATPCHHRASSPPRRRRRVKLASPGAGKARARSCELLASQPRYSERVCPPYAPALGRRRGNAAALPNALNRGAQSDDAHRPITGRPPGGASRDVRRRGAEGSEFELLA
jgi:hypothetical protein